MKRKKKTVDSNIVHSGNFLVTVVESPNEFLSTGGRG